MYAGHRDYWFSLMLHRDVSTGNVLICPTSDVDIKVTSGKLIDLDYSKKSDKRVEYPALTDISERRAKIVAMAIEDRFSVSVSTDIARVLASRYPDNYTQYIPEALKMMPRTIAANEPVIYAVYFVILQKLTQ